MKNEPEYPDNQDGLIKELAERAGIEDFAIAQVLWDLSEEMLDVSMGHKSGPHLAFILRRLRPHSIGLSIQKGKSEMPWQCESCNRILMVTGTGLDGKEVCVQCYHEHKPTLKGLVQQNAREVSRLKPWQRTNKVPRK